MKILVIDDEPIARKLLVHQLGRLGFEDVEACDGGQNALDVVAAASQPVELIFCDLQMPGMDGVEFVRHLTRRGYAGNLVLVSGEGDRILQTAGKLAQGHKLRVLGSLSKPVTMDGLRKVLQQRVSPEPPSGAAGAPVYDAHALRRAIAEGELVNHYQPKVDLVTGAVTGVETLVRWAHPSDGLIFPDAFVTLAEDSGLIDALTRTVLRQSLRHAREWQMEGLALQVGINVSMDNLVALDFPDCVARAVQESGLPPGSLMLEVTESRLMKDPLTHLDILTRLRLKRIGLSIDDFGTGHSSLAQLRDIPFTELKIDRGFVHGAARDPSLRAIVEASLGMARQLDMTVVAEGVESREDWDFLRAKGCGFAQGWFVARAMPPEQIPDWVAEWELRRPTLVGGNQ